MIRVLLGLFLLLSPSAGAQIPELPTLLRPGLITAPEICADARRAHPEKHLALIALKTHLCDLSNEAHSCLHVLRTVADPCNHFVRDHFALYHARLYRCPPNGGDCAETPGSDDISHLWGNGGLDLIVLDLDSCRELGRTGAGIARFNDIDPVVRIAAMREQLLRKIPSLAPRLGLKSFLDEMPENERTCPADPDRAAGRTELMDVWRQLEK